ncbi:MarR family winged helix-turn-helix transcriptional regulator [Streptomyces glomeratus]|uniref:HTH marR-type domain-containing protein n=1 Tax=Streptomyces glomeratus TaxID=284452 RepID=A0ABP6M377_9ACTN|nr:MarR family winged helix-turn-helix transcriptional regulator [Streptomyces glomeratus]MCF1511364.1 MarR family winged helix-turn-helix transcriptional regulator [Streptomyces glomeratus]
MSDYDLSDTTRWQFPGVLRTLGLVHAELRVRHGLSLHDYLILGALAEAASGSVHVAKLAAFLQESGDRMSYLLRGLQAAGLIDRHRRAGDRRTVEATLTDAGRSRFAAAETSAQALMRQYLGPGLDTQESSGRSCDVT